MEQLKIARAGNDLCILPQMANRHGMIAGATGTGKTITLRVLAENFSRIGVPVFMADVKGDLSGLAKAGGEQPKVLERVKQFGLENFPFQAFPVVYWDVFGESGHPVRATISEIGPLMLGRILQLNETQAGVLSLVFKIADDNGLLLLDLKDLRAMAQYVGDNPDQFRTTYGNVSAASIGAIQRNLLKIEQEGGTKLFGEPALDVNDLLQTDQRGLGQINILAADKLMQAPQLYSTMLLWLLSELYETLPEVGDLDKPKLVFFFDEAHLLFSDAPKALMQKIEQVVRLIRSKGVGIYFVSQNPLDVPDAVLGQLGNRVQHALRAFTPRDQKAVRAAAETFRANPGLEVEKAITELGVGEALVSFLNEKGQPSMVERAFIMPPQSRIAPLSAAERQEHVRQSLIYGHYEKEVDRESAFEILTERARKAVEPPVERPVEREERVPLPQRPEPQRRPEPYRRPAARRSDSLFGAAAKSTVRSVGSALGREIVRGVLGSILGGRR